MPASGPILIVGPEILLFESVQAAERYMEAPDVRDGEYLFAIDSRGSRLNLRIEGQGRWIPVERVKIAAVGQSEPEANAFRSALIAFLRQYEVSGHAIEALGVDELLALALRFKTG